MPGGLTRLLPEFVYRSLPIFEAFPSALLAHVLILGREKFALSGFLSQ